MRKLRQWLRRHELRLVLSLLALLTLVVQLAPNIFIFLGPGEKGVLWRRFLAGTDVDTVFEEGTCLIFPWDVMTVYDTRVQTVDRTFDTLSSNGLTVQVQMSIRYSPDRRRLGYLHKEVGTNFLEVVVLPEVGAALRVVVARYEPADLYTIARPDFQRQVTELARAEAAERYVHVDDVQIRSVVLPPSVQQAIETKLAEEQRALQYQYTLRREQQEADRKRIEAAGIRDFQQLVANGISEEYLQWKGIEATLDLAKSTNAKVVIIGSSENGLPLILNTDSTAAQSGQTGVQPGLAPPVVPTPPVPTPATGAPGSPPVPAVPSETAPQAPVARSPLPPAPLPEAPRPPIPRLGAATQGQSEGPA